MVSKSGWVLCMVLQRTPKSFCIILINAKVKLSENTGNGLRAVSTREQSQASGVNFLFPP